MTTPALVLAFSLGGPEILLILAVLILLFGAKKLPELARGMGRSMKEFKKATQEEDPEPTAEELKAQLAATKAELAAKERAQGAGNKGPGGA